MKKRILFALAACLLLVFAAACTKPQQPAEPTEDPAAAELTPEPTQEPVVLGVTESPAPEAEPVTFSDLVISDADVDGVMNEDVNGWDGFSVLTVEYEGQSIFYVIPENNSVDETKAIGSVVMNYDTNRVTSLNCQVDLTKLDMHKAQIEQLYTYFRDQFPFEVVSGLTEEAWSALQTQLDMSFDSAVAASATGTETRQLAGQFVFHVAKDLISLDFFVA